MIIIMMILKQWRLQNNGSEGEKKKKKCGIRVSENVCEMEVDIVMQYAPAPLPSHCCNIIKPTAALPCVNHELLGWRQWILTCLQPKANLTWISI